MPEAFSKPDAANSRPHANAGNDQLHDGLPPPKPDLEAQATETPAERPDYSIYTTWQKRGIVLGAAMGAFLSPLTAQIYFPALNVLASEFGVSDSEINLTVTTYMIFQGITPMFIGSIADSTGRRPAYFICFVVYVAANIGCALAPSYGALLALRMLQSAGSSTLVSLCQAVVSDIITSAERGQYVAFGAVPTILAPSLGPVLGGIIARFLGWRWIFWFLVILSGTTFALFAAFMPETCRHIVDDGSRRPPKAYSTFWQLGHNALKAWRTRKNQILERTTSRISTPRSFKLKKPDIFKALSILRGKEMFLLLFYSAIVFAGFYAISTAMPALLVETYGLDNLKVGLMFLPLAGGSIVSAFLMGKLINWNYRRHCMKLGVPIDRKKQQDLTDFPIEKARLEVSIPLLLLSVAVMMSWGWVFEYKAHIAVPCVLLFLLGIGLIGFNNTTSVLIVDMNPGHAGSATASNNLTRCLTGAAASAVIAPMISGIGAGWAFFIIGILYLAGLPMIYFIMKHGMRWRMEEQEKAGRDSSSS